MLEIICDLNGSGCKFWRAKGYPGRSNADELKVLYHGSSELERYLAL